MNTPLPPVEVVLQALAEKTKNHDFGRWVGSRRSRTLDGFIRVPDDLLHAAAKGDDWAVDEVLRILAILRDEDDLNAWAKGGSFNLTLNVGTIRQALRREA